MKQSFIDKLANAFGYIKAVSMSVGAGAGIPSWPWRKAAQELESMRGWVYACTTARATDVSAIKLHLYKVTDRATGETEEVTDHEVLSLLRKVNPWMTFRELIEYTQIYKDLTGEAFWYLAKNGKTTTQIWLLRPDWVSIKTSAESFILGYEYRVPGQAAVPIPPEQMIHFKTFNPTDPYRGLSVVRAAAISVDSEVYAEEYNRKFFENSAIPALVLETDQKLDDRVKKRMREQWQTEYGGTEKSHKLAILEGGLKVNPFSITHAEMQFLEGQKFTRDKIFALFKVPKTVLGMTEDVTVSNAEATDLVFAKRVVKPLMRAINETLTEFLLPQYDDSGELFFDFDDPVPENRAARIAEYKDLFAIGAVTPNEIRQAEGLDEVPGLDQFYLPINMIPISNESDDPALADEPIKGRRGSMKKKVKAPPQTLKHYLGEKISRKITDKVMKQISARHSKHQANEEIGVSKIPAANQEAAWKIFVEKSINFEKRYITTLKEFFARQEKDALEKLEKTQKISRSQANSVLFELTAENKVAAQLLLPILEQFMEEAGNDAFDLLGLSDQTFDTTSETVKQFFKIDALKGIRAMNRVTKSKLRRVLSAAVQDGKGIPEIAADIKNVFREADTVRATRIARTEVIRAGNRGALEAYKQSGVVVGKQWFTALDEQVCEWCSVMQGKTKALDNAYFHQGESFTGKEGGIINLDFTTVQEPPLHPNCRCTLIPITR